MIDPKRTRSAGVTVMEIPLRITDNRTKSILQKLFFGPFRQTKSTLIAALPSSRRVNSWLSFKRLFWAVPGKAGGTAVMTTVDHTLMRGLKPHDQIGRAS